MKAACMVLLALAPSAALAKAVENFAIAMGSEADIADGSNVLYYENVLWAEKSWRTFSRTSHAIYFGSELLLEPMDNDFTGRTRWGFDTQSLILGYKLGTYLPDWYNFNVRLRVPVHMPADPFGRARCPEEPLPAPGSRFEAVNPPPCAPFRAFADRLQLKLDPLLYRKTWNTRAVYDRNRFTVTLETIEYSNYLKLISLTPDLEFPIAMYLGNEFRFRVDYAQGVDRVRNDFIVGLASNFADWMHLGVELMYHLDSKTSANRQFLIETYLEFYFEIFFDNTRGTKARGAHEEERT